MNRLARPMQYNSFIEYGRELAASADIFHPMNESSSGLLLLYHATTFLQQPLPSPLAPFLLYQPNFSSIPILYQETDNALVSSPEPRVSMSSDDHLYSSSSHTRLHLNNARNEIVDLISTKLYEITLWNNLEISVKYD
ncbi:hypothetical protein EVAR_56299_1 [Eumeta japonica]|uniref:Uncharacterized protein n=1 Tax=Eumeta variegata TaxID=151549 RepID=A0A4C1Z4J9_EUMVA|nr:hypothetical protein EVAR_56299_1 [Eumeta japonica]